MKEGDIVFLLDKINPETKQPTLGRVDSVTSDRTCTIEYVKTKVLIDPITFKISKNGKKHIVTRPFQQLCYITSENNKNEEIDVDAFSQLDKDSLQEILPSDQNPIMSEVHDEFFDDSSTSLQDENIHHTAGKRRPTVKLPEKDTPIIADL